MSLNVISDSTETIDILQKQPNPLAYKAGQVIFREGQPVDLKYGVMYGVIEGEVEVLVNDQPVEVIQAGKVFGIGALINGEIRPYTAVSKTNCQLTYFNKEEFLLAIQKTPWFAIEVMRSYFQRIDRLNIPLG